jgi:hypothetical protein
MARQMIGGDASTMADFAMGEVGREDEDPHQG